MSKLLVLSEIDCRSFLEEHGVFPDEFYTDFMLFKNKSSSFIDSDIIVIFAGSCSFSKRHVLEIVNVLNKRAKDVDDKGVNSLLVFTDVFLPSLDKYYKFQGSLKNISEYSGWKLKDKNSDILLRVPKGTKNTDMVSYLTSRDDGVVDDLREEYKSSFAVDEDLRKLIKKPDFSSISEI